MVGLHQTSVSAPVATAHNLIHLPNATVISTLSALTPPPLPQIPYLDTPSATPNSWVQCLAMVQDIWDAELFISSSPSGASGLLVENAACSEDSRSKLAERLPIYLVAPPGETAWARAARLPSTLQAVRVAPAGTKRAREESDDVDARVESMEEMPQPATLHSAQASSSGAPATSDKRSRADTAGERCPAAPTGLGLNLPVPGQQGGFAVVAKVYDGELGRSLRVNTLVHVIGILQEAMPVAGEGEFAEEMRARNPAIVQRLHVVKMREVGEKEGNPVLGQLGSVERIVSARQELLGVLGEVRAGCLKYLASALGGDMLAAEYLLMGLLSRPAVRTGSGVLGNLCVNFVVSEGGCAGIVGMLERVCPMVVRIGVNIAGLNAGELYPKKDYDLNRVKAGVLQLADGCVLVGDETGMSDGRLAERGVRNVKALKRVIGGGMTPIDFSYYEAEAPVGCCVVLVSKGGKSIIGGDVVVKVVDSGNAGGVEWNRVSEDELKKLRMMFGLLAEDGKFDIEAEASKEVEEAYVKAREEGRAKEGQEVLQGWLGVARSCARSFGEVVLSKERWRYAWALEQKRMERMST